MMTVFNTLLFGDDKIPLSDSDYLQEALYTLHNATKYLEIKCLP
jgi:hypothetical protein